MALLALLFLLPAAGGNRLAGPGTVTHYSGQGNQNRGFGYVREWAAGFFVAGSSINGAPPRAPCPLPSALCPLPAASCQLPAASCQLPAASCLLPVDHALRDGPWGCRCTSGKAIIAGTAVSTANSLRDPCNGPPARAAGPAATISACLPADPHPIAEMNGVYHRVESVKGGTRHEFHLAYLNQRTGWYFTYVKSLGPSTSDRPLRSFHSSLGPMSAALSMSSGAGSMSAEAAAGSSLHSMQRLAPIGSLRGQGASDLSSDLRADLPEPLPTLLKANNSPTSQTSSPTGRGWGRDGGAAWATGEEGEGGHCGAGVGARADAGQPVSPLPLCVPLSAGASPVPSLGLSGRATGDGATGGGAGPRELRARSPSFLGWLKCNSCCGYYPDVESLRSHSRKCTGSAPGASHRPHQKRSSMSFADPILPPRQHSALVGPLPPPLPESGSPQNLSPMASPQPPGVPPPLSPPLPSPSPTSRRKLLPSLNLPGSGSPTSVPPPVPGGGKARPRRRSKFNKMISVDTSDTNDTRLTCPMAD
eukprot:gene2440-513_t